MTNFWKFYENPDDSMKDYAADLILTIIGFEGAAVGNLTKTEKHIFLGILNVFVFHIFI